MYTQLHWNLPACNVMEIYLLIFFTSGLVFSTDAMTDMCDRCLNNSTCRIITNLQSNVSTIHCACLQGWLGERCQVRVRLLLVSFTMTTATLQWKAQPTYSQNTNFSESSGKYSFQTQVEFNVNYWTNSQRSECNIVPNLTRTVFTISGLNRGTEYTFCAKTDHSHTCDFVLVSHYDNAVPSCVSVTTKADDNSIPTIYLVITSLIAMIGLIVLIVVVIIAKRNNYLNFVLCVKQNDSRRQTGSAIQGPSLATYLADDSRPDIYLLKSPKINHTISITPPNCPGKPKYKIKKRLRGYAAFSAQNEQTIPLSTVLEYSEHVDDEFEDSDIDSDTVAETCSDTERTDHQITDTL